MAKLEKCRFEYQVCIFSFWLRIDIKRILITFNKKGMGFELSSR